ncbi:hypothetical protein AK972_4840 [Pseudomonas yamanorum]|nr:hypothetical protein AK972_4840 [Pseudomonas yamanorum]
MGLTGKHCGQLLQLETLEVRLLAMQPLHGGREVVVISDEGLLSADFEMYCER